MPGDIIGEPQFSGYDTYFVGHIGIVGPNLQVYEVIKGGPSKFSSVESFVSRFDNPVGVYRPNGATSADMANAAYWASTHYTDVDSYVIDGNLSSLNWNYCSKFVWQAYFFGSNFNIGVFPYTFEQDGMHMWLRGTVTPGWILDHSTRITTTTY
ncbi:hypothetical protein GCM10008967_27820 [Bacillus carboniphilus]|uniref:Uncharacterized protein n=1 Tax=Bacillus carboniphilus TaxID=86663 RepID=A0ABP3G5V9_9BACI